MERKSKQRKIGIEVKTPKDTCTDKNCPFHGDIVVRKKTIVGKVVSIKMNKSAVIEREIRKYIPKYERYLKTKSRMSVHAPTCLNIKEGDFIKVALTRPLSKTKTYVAVEVVNEEH